jgi:hypothetical protein
VNDVFGNHGVIGVVSFSRVIKLEGYKEKYLLEFLGLIYIGVIKVMEIIRVVRVVSFIRLIKAY